MTDGIRESILRLQTLRDSKVLLYFLSDRRSPIPVPGINTIFATEPQLLIYDHLKRLGHIPRLDLVIHTSGGDLNAVWPLVNLCRDMSDHFSIIVPFRSLSAGTLLCLGAEEVLMGTAANLSPIDPTTTNQFNPVDSRGQPKGISVEDVISYFKLARDKNKGTGISEEKSITEIFKQITDKVDPLALGNVNRVHTQIRDLADKLLHLHADHFIDDNHIANIIKVLTEELHSHSHQIGVQEAITLFGNNFIKRPSEEIEEAMWNLFDTCALKFKIRNTFNLKEWIGIDSQKRLKIIGAILYSENITHAFITHSNIRQMPELPQQVQIQLPPGQQMPLIPGLPTRLNIEPISEGWYIIEEGQDFWGETI
jgi:hypothetical protein